MDMRSEVADPLFAKRQGALLLRVTGDIKRNPEFLAEEIKEPLATVQAVFAGTASPGDVNRIVEKMVARYPFSRLNLEVIRDDTDEGLVLSLMEDAEKRARVFDRKDKDGNLTPYYEYRDAAMSTLGPFKPEWIRELRFVSSKDPRDPDVAYNKGHFLHQLTLFVGPVNFYYEDGNGVHMGEMETGDSSYKTPYAPHTFAVRSATEEAYIMAVTFCGKLEMATQRELAVLPPAAVKESLLDLSAADMASGGLLSTRARNALHSSGSLARCSGITEPIVTELLAGRRVPNLEELEQIARALEISVRDLMPPSPAMEKEVVVRRHAETVPEMYPSEQNARYALRRLAKSSKVAELNGFTIAPLLAGAPRDMGELDLLTDMHTFAYNYGDAPMTLFWEGDHGMRTATLPPRASFYLKPLRKHAIRNVESTGSLMVVRLGGTFSGDSFFELSSLPKGSIERLLKETGVWY